MGYAESHARLEGFLALIPAKTRDLYAPLVDELAFQEAKLDETRRILKNAAVAVSGKDAKMPHKNAVFEGYNSLFAQYLKGLQVLAAAIPAKEQADEVKPKGALVKFRERSPLRAV